MSIKKTFRLFLSSTFNDLRAERDKLQAEVFPRLRKYCEDRGFSFQAIDLRWGVSSEAGFDQKTMQICLDEVKRCKNSLNPHFAIMLGERYGWIPLPAKVKKEEFETVKKAILGKYSSNQDIIDMINYWYRLDTNSINQEYVLQIRTNEYEDWNKWGHVENTLRECFMSVVKNELKDILNNRQKAKYIKSATEQEIIEGLFNNIDVAKHNIYFYNRDFTNIDTITPKQFEELEKKDKEYRKQDSTYTVTIKQFSDFENFIGNNIDKQIRPNHEKLITKIKENLPDENIKEYPLVLDPTLDRTQDSVTSEYLEKFVKDFENTIMKSIKKEIENFEDISVNDRELNEQNSFLEEKSKVFVGRDKILEKIDNYLFKDISNTPLVIHANSGSGKSSLMAKAISNTNNKKEENTKLIYRFIGTSQLSNTITNVLKSIYNQLVTQDENIKYTFEGYAMQNNLQLETILGNTKELCKMFSNFFATCYDKIILFIDALDQFSIDDTLEWLPKELSNNIKIVLSTLPNNDYENIKYLPILKDKYLNNKNQFLFLEPFDTNEAKQMCDEYLKSIGRVITQTQKDKVLQAFSQNGSPLYLKILLEEANQWKSYDNINNEVYPKKLEELISRLFKRLNSKSHHSLPLVEYAFSYISCSKDGVSEPELFDILSREQKLMNDVSNEFYPRPLRLPTAVWARLYSQMSHYMTIKEIDGVDQISFFHRKFNEGAYNLIGKKLSHENLAKFYEDVYYKNISINSALKQLPYQLAMSNQIEKSLQLLTNFDFLMKKFYLNKIDEVLEDFALVKELKFNTSNEITQELKDRFYIFDNFITSNAYILKNGNKEYDSSKIFFQLAIEHANNSPLTIAAKKYHVNFDYAKKIDIPNSIYISPLVAVLDGNIGGVRGVKHIDNNNLISFSSDKKLKIWDKKEFKCKEEISTFTKDIIDIIILENIIIIYNQDVIKFIDKTSFIILKELEITNIKRVFISRNTFIVFCEAQVKVIENFEIKTFLEDENIKNIQEIDDNYLLIIYENYSIVLDKNSLEIIKKIEIKQVKYIRKQNNLIAFSSWSSGVLTILDSNSFENIKVLELFDTQIDGIEFIQNNIIVFAMNNFDIQVLNIDGFESLGVLKDHSKNIKGVKSNLNGDIITFAYDNSIKIWDKNSFKLKATLIGHQMDITDIKFLENGNIISFSMDSTIRVWDKNNFEQIGVLEGQLYGVSGLEFLDKNLVLSYSWDDNMRIWDLNNIKYAKKDNQTMIINSIDYKEKNLFVYDEKNIFVYDKSSAKNIAKISAHTSKIVGLKFDNKNIISYSWDKIIKIWDKEDFNCKAILKGHSLEIEDIELFDDKIVSYSKDKTLKIWDKSSGECIKTLDSHTSLITGIVVEKYIISYSNDKTIRIYDKEDFNCLKIIEFNDIIRGVKILKNQNILAFSQDGYIKICDGNTLEIIHEFKGHDSFIIDIYFLENDNILSFSGDKTIKIWQKDDFKLLGILQGHLNSIMDVKILDNNNILSWSADKTLKVWDKNSFECIATLEHDNRPITNLKLSKKHILSFMFDKTIKIWSQETFELIDIIDEDNTLKYLEYLLSFDDTIESDDYIFENHFEKFSIDIKDKKTNKVLKWFSNSKPKPKNVLSNKLLVDNSSFVELIEVIRKETK